MKYSAFRTLARVALSLASALFTAGAASAADTSPGTPAPSTQPASQAKTFGSELTDYADRASPLLTVPPSSDEVAGLNSLEAAAGGSTGAAQTATASAATATQPATAATSSEPAAKKGEWLIAPLPD